MPHNRLAAGDDCVEFVAPCKVGLDVHLAVLLPMFTPCVQTMAHCVARLGTMRA